MIKIQYEGNELLPIEKFRDDILIPAINLVMKDDEVLIIDFGDLNMSEESLDIIFGEYIRKYKNKDFPYHVAIVSNNDSDNPAWRQAVEIINQEIKKL